MIFKVLSISHGWFEVDFNREFILDCTGATIYDPPYELLEALADLLESKSTEIYLCWPGEPGAHILNFGKQGDNLVVQIYETDCVSSYEL
jgi:hypothetical protein